MCDRVTNANLHFSFLIIPNTHTPIRPCQVHTHLLVEQCLVLFPGTHVLPQFTLISCYLVVHLGTAGREGGREGGRERGRGREGGIKREKEE